MDECDEGYDEGDFELPIVCSFSFDSAYAHDDDAYGEDAGEEHDEEDAPLVSEKSVRYALRRLAT